MLKIIFWDFTEKRVTLKWFNLHKLCKNISKTTFSFLYSHITWFTVQRLCDAQNDIQKSRFLPNFVPKNGHFGPYFAVYRSNHKNNQKNGFLDPKNICVDGLNLNFKPVDFILSLFKKSIFWLAAILDFRYLSFRNIFERANK